MKRRESTGKVSAGRKAGKPGGKVAGQAVKKVAGRERELTEKQRNFVRFYAGGDYQREAYRKAYSAKRLSDASCDANASRLLRNAKVIAFLAELRKKADDEAVINRRKRMVWLSRVVTTAPDDVDGKSDLCQEKSVSEFGMRCRMPDKLRAIQELNRMDGAYEPEKLKVEGELSFASLLKGLKNRELVSPGGKGKNGRNGNVVDEGGGEDGEDEV